MPKYTAKQVVKAPAEEVFAFVSDVSRMPEYLPTVHQARPQGSGRVQLEGNSAGKDYEVDGYCETDPDKRVMRWGADGNMRYSGHMEIQDRGAECNVNVTLDFEPTPEMDNGFRERDGGRDAAIQEGLERSLESIRNICEGVGGKVPTSADQGYLG